MNFGSKYVYEYPDSEEECVSEDEYETGLSRAWSSDEDEAPVASPPPPPPVASPPPPPPASKSAGGGFLSKIFGSKDKKPLKTKSEGAAAPGKKAKKKHHWLSKKSASAASDGGSAPTGEKHPQGRKWRRADTNLLSVNFERLTAPPNMHTGDPVYCSGCQAVLSHLSKVNEEEVRAGEMQQIWRCEFCRTSNPVDLVAEEIPSKDDVTFMLQPAPCTTSSGRTGADHSLVIFCVDTSGSMCVTTEVPGRIRMRGDRLASLQSLNDTRESQYMPGQRRDVTFVTRLQSVQAAVDQQLGDMAKQHPDRRLALITFSTEVTVVGDGSADPIHFSGDKLSNRAELIKAGAELGLPKVIRESRETLGGKVFDLEEGGQTALGPALLIAISMASGKPGSKVIMCTDGMANVGLGGLDAPTDDPKYTEATQFYDEVSEMASENGVSVSVISIKGADCKLVELGKLSDATGGQVNIVDPLKLTEEFGSILADPIIATNVTATLQVHKKLYIRHELDAASRAVRKVGNVTKSSEITFEYGVRRKKGKKEKEEEERKKRELSAIFEKTEPLYDNPKPSVVPEEPIYDNPNEVKAAAAAEKKEAEEKMEVDQEPVYDNQKGAGGEGGAAGGAEGGAVGDAKANGATGGMEVDSDEEDGKDLPFQLQITYTDLDGAQAMRLITQNMPVTKDRDVAEQAINPVALTVHAAQVSARLAQGGEYSHSRMNAFMYQRLMHRAVSNPQSYADEVQYETYCDVVGEFSNNVMEQQRREMTTLGHTYSDDEDGEEMAMVYDRERARRQPLPSARRGAFSKKSSSRSAACPDGFANELYANAQISSSRVRAKKPPASRLPDPPAARPAARAPPQPPSAASAPGALSAPPSALPAPSPEQPAAAKSEQPAAAKPEEPKPEEPSIEEPTKPPTEDISKL